jgi:hypothetical protein
VRRYSTKLVEISTPHLVVAEFELIGQLKKLLTAVMEVNIAVSSRARNKGLKAYPTAVNANVPRRIANVNASRANLAHEKNEVRTQSASLVTANGPVESI